MNLLQVLFLVTGGAVTAFLAVFVISSVVERKPRAAIMSFLSMVVFAAVWFGALFVCPFAESLLLPSLLIVALLLVLFFGPIGSTRSMKVSAISGKVDERDTMFAREEYQPGTERYETYYTRHPELKAQDDRIRRLPELLAPGGRYYDPEKSNGIRDTFAQIKELTTIVDGKIAGQQTDIDPTKTTADIKAMTLKLGADEVGIGQLNPMFVYSHVGRGPELYGAPIDNSHSHVISFTLEMDYHQVELAPTFPTVEETARKYLEAARISVKLAEHIRSLGYSARAHISDSNYQIMLPAVAVDSGLGELGRCGYLISPKFGPRIRLGGVTTDLPLVTDSPIEFGVQDFCDRCKKCAVNCPSAAIPKDEPVDVRGVEKWPTNVEQCIRYWRIAGTDCGLCMKVCPFSHPSTFVHNIVKAGIKRSSFARTISLWGDDLFYGKKAKWEAPDPDG